MGKKADDKKKRDQSAYHKKLRKMNAAHRLAHKLSQPFERIEKYLDDVNGDDDIAPWHESEEIAVALEALLLAMGAAIKVLNAKPVEYVARAAKPRVRVQPCVGAIVSVMPKFREDYGVIFDNDEMDQLSIVEMKENGRIFVRPVDEADGRPVGMRRSEVRVVTGGENLEQE